MYKTIYKEKKDWWNPVVLVYVIYYFLVNSESVKVVYVTWAYIIFKSIVTIAIHIIYDILIIFIVIAIFFLMNSKNYIL